MENKLVDQINKLRSQVKRLLLFFSNSDIKASNFTIDLPVGFEKDFFALIDKINFLLMEDEENFYGYFLFQTTRELRFDMNSATGVNFKNASYVIYFNPLIFLNLTTKQMQTSIKHEILHILSLHLIRVKKMKEKFSTLAINMAMDMVVNQYLNYLPPDAVTIEATNKKYALSLSHGKPFEYYVEKMQYAIELLEEKEEENQQKEDAIATEFDPNKTHDIWEESNELEDSTMEEFTTSLAMKAKKGEIPSYLNTLLDSLKNRKEELPWDLYLKRLMGTLDSSKKKTITRRNRRQPNRLDLRGELSGHKANILLAIDISGSIDEEEFKKAMTEVLGIINNYGHQITVVECDNEIQRIYPLKTKKDLKERSNSRGGTKFTPVFEYANKNKVDLLIYFTDGKGEEKLEVIPKGYKVLWIIFGRGDTLSVKEPYGAIKKLKKVKIKDNVLDHHDVERGGFSMNHHESIL